MYLHKYMCVQVPTEAEAGVTGSSEPTVMGAETQTQVLWKKKQQVLLSTEPFLQPKDTYVFFTVL